MKCLMKYQWVKLPRNHLPEGKGIMNAWAKLQHSVRDKLLIADISTL